MKHRLLPVLLAALGLSAAAAQAQALAQTSYISCQVQTVFHKPGVHGSEWTHVENQYTKIFQIDAAAKMVAVWNNRSLKWTPICAPGNSACQVSWGADGIGIDATKAPDSPLPPYLDFRRKISLNAANTQVDFTIADYGGVNADAPISWNYTGQCQPATAPSTAPYAPPGGFKSNPLYQKATGPAQPVSQAEAAKVLAGYIGNSMTGYSGGGHWFHMWFLKESPVVAYTSDDYDISSEGKPRQWWIGKDSTGYRICPAVDVANNTGMKMQPGVNCYPLLVKKVGDTWVEHDMDGDAYFSLLPGRV
jgi:hypothetical protein